MRRELPSVDLDALPPGVQMPSLRCNRSQTMEIETMVLETDYEKDERGKKTRTNSKINRSVSNLATRCTTA